MEPINNTSPKSTKAVAADTLLDVRAAIETTLRKCAGVGEESISVSEIPSAPGWLRLFFEYDKRYESVIDDEVEECTVIAESYDYRIAIVEKITF